MIDYFDMHCHIIPDVDDGAKGMDMSLQLLKAEYDGGIRNIILTPHFRLGMFETPSALILEKYQLLKKAASSQFPDLNLYLGCEFHSTHDMTRYIDRHERYRMAGSRYLLLEFSGRHSAKDIRERTYEAISHGLIPIIAHCERYDPVAENLDFADDLIDMGAKLQVNADSILGYDGRKAKKFCKSLLKYDMISFIGSDCHDLHERTTHMGECIAFLEKKYGSEQTREILYDNPMKIIHDGQQG